MSNNRIRVAKDKAELVVQLVMSKDSTGPFATYADVIAFSACVGRKYHKRVALTEISKREPGSIDLDVFVARGYDLLIKILGFIATEDLRVLSSDLDNHDCRNLIFEEYANGGLEVLQNELKGAADYSDRLLLLLSSNDFKLESLGTNFDLTKLLF